MPVAGPPSSATNDQLSLAGVGQAMATLGGFLYAGGLSSSVSFAYSLIRPNLVFDCDHRLDGEDDEDGAKTAAPGKTRVGVWARKSSGPLLQLQLQG